MRLVCTGFIIPALHCRHEQTWEMLQHPLMLTRTKLILKGFINKQWYHFEIPADLVVQHKGEDVVIVILYKLSPSW